MNLETLAILVLYVDLRRNHRSWVVRRKAAIMISASFVPLVVNSWYIFVHSMPPFDLGVATVVFSSALLMLGIYRTGLFNPLPVAIPEVLFDDPTSVVLVDARGYPFFANTAAREDLPPAVWQGREDLRGWMSRSLRSADGSSGGGGRRAERLYRQLGSDRLIRVRQIPIRTRGGLTVSDRIARRSGAVLFRDRIRRRTGWKIGVVWLRIARIGGSARVSSRLVQINHLAHDFPEPGDALRAGGAR